MSGSIPLHIEELLTATLADAGPCPPDSFSASTSAVAILLTSPCMANSSQAPYLRRISNEVHTGCHEGCTQRLRLLSAGETPITVHTCTTAFSILQ